MRAPLKNYLLLFCLILPASLNAQDNLPINVSFGKTAQDPIFAYDQHINIDGDAEKNVTCIGGTVTVKGTVHGDITSLNGKVVIVPPTGRVKGDIVCLGGEVTIADRNALGGKLTHLFASDGEKPAAILGSTWSHVSFYFGHSLLLFLLVALCFYAFPNQVNEAGFQLTQDLVRPAIIGLTIWAALITLYFLSFLLMVVAVGFPLLLITFTASVIVTLFGTAVVFYQLGQWMEHLTSGKIGVGLGIVISVLLAGLLFYVPLLGELMVFCVAVFGTGVVIETRFGTNKQWFTRKARYWAA